LQFNFKHVKGYCFSAQSVLDIPVGNIVEVPLAQTGEGIAECELLKWYVQEVSVVLI
jgi:2-oxoisovalerate dehydrogenase E2 component (dihydrolipoyl transacylase)